MEFVVARYREDLNWLAECLYPGTVYDKSGGCRSLAAALPEVFRRWNCEPLPNMGREAHTYLTHILRRYDSLPDYTVFLQGDPFPHMAFDAAGLNAAAHGLAERKKPFGGLAYYKLKCDGLGRPHSLADPESRGKWAGWGKDIPVDRVHRALFAGEPPREYLVRAPAGLFFVSRARILARPRAFYRRALDLVEADPHDAANTGHAFERLWHLIFDGYAGRNRPEDLLDGP